MKGLSLAGHPVKETLIPGPYGQCMTQVTRGDTGQNFKIRRGTYVQIFPGFVHMYGCFGHHFWL